MHPIIYLDELLAGQPADGKGTHSPDPGLDLMPILNYNGTGLLNNPRMDWIPSWCVDLGDGQPDIK